MSAAIFEILRKGNTQNKLTVAVDRTTLKLRDDVTPADEVILARFATLVADEIRPRLTQTLRGQIETALIDGGPGVHLRTTGHKHEAVVIRGQTDGTIASVHWWEA